ncbi:MAG TPA: hypothetical protein VF952_14435 [Chloroflexia bacterium]
MLRTILKLIPVFVLTCVLVVGSWEPNNFGLSLGASPSQSLIRSCWQGVEGTDIRCMETPVISLPSWLQEVISPVATVIALFITLYVLFSLNQHLAYQRNRSVVTGFIGKQRVFYVQRGLAAHRARHKL